MKSDNRFPKGSRGGVSRVTVRGVKENHDEVRQHWKPGEKLDENFSTVGLSVSVSESTDYAREKYEVSAWCSLPTPTDPESIQESYEIAYDYVVEEIERRRSDVRKRFFPHLMTDDDYRVAKKERT